MEMEKSKNLYLFQIQRRKIKYTCYFISTKIYSFKAIAIVHRLTFYILSYLMTDPAPKESNSFG